MNVLFTSSVYALGKRLGHDEAHCELERQLARGDTWTANTAADAVPSVLTALRLRDVVAELRGQTAVAFDLGGTPIGKVRSRQFTLALETGVDIWVSCDDDIETTRTTLRGLLHALDTDRAPRLVTVPYRLRDEGAPLSVEWETTPGAPLLRELDSGTRLRRCGPGGFGLVGANRLALEAMANDSTPYFDDDDGRRIWAPFYDLIGRMPSGRVAWLGEDYSFWSRVPPHVSVEALCSGLTIHDGVELDLYELEEWKS